MKLLSSTKIAIGFAVIIGATYFGYQQYARQAIDQEKFAPLIPDEAVNLIGISPKGYHIIITNQIAHLVEGGTEDFDVGGGGDEPASGGDKKRVPIKEMLQSLRGDEDALSRFLMKMNDLSEDSLPPDRVIWTAEDLNKALDGDPELEPKLVKDLNVQLDGTPIDEIRVRSLENGIVIKAPVEVKVAQGDETLTLTGNVLSAYKPRFVEAVQNNYRDKVEVTEEMIKGYYLQEAQELVDDPRKKENVAASIREMISKESVGLLAEAPEKLLESSTVIITGPLIESASYEEVQIGAKQLYNLKMVLTNEGRRRLWQYSRRHPGSQIMLVVNGVAVAAPKIGHDLAQKELTITQMPNESLVQEAVEAMNSSSQRTTQK